MTIPEPNNTPRPDDATRTLRRDQYRSIIVAWRKPTATYGSVPDLWEEVPEDESVCGACLKATITGKYALAVGYFWRPVTGYELHVIYRPDGLGQFLDVLSPGHFATGPFWEFMGDMMLSLLASDVDDTFTDRYEAAAV